jgi:hypothetical protein
MTGIGAKLALNQSKTVLRYLLSANQSCMGMRIQKRMVPMNDVKQREKGISKTQSTQIHEKRYAEERRKEPSCGFTCITMVGWICRREQVRRKDDPDCFSNDKP